MNKRPLLIIILTLLTINCGSKNQKAPPQTSPAVVRSEPHQTGEPQTTVGTDATDIPSTETPKIHVSYFLSSDKQQIFEAPLALQNEASDAFCRYESQPDNKNLLLLNYRDPQSATTLSATFNVGALDLSKSKDAILDPEVSKIHFYDSSQDIGVESSGPVFCKTTLTRQDQIIQIKSNCQNLSAKKKTVTDEKNPPVAADTTFQFDTDCLLLN